LTKEIALYIATIFKNGNDVRKASKDLSMLTIRFPEDTDATASAKRSEEGKNDECTKRRI